MPDKSITTGCFLFGCIAAVFLLFCAGGSGDFAGGVETTNGMTVVAAAGEIRVKTAPQTRIIISDTAYTPIQLQMNRFADTGYTGSDGGFVFTRIPAGAYNLFAQKSDFDSGCIVRNITVDSSSTGTRRDSSRFVPLVALAAMVKLATAPQLNSIVFIRGTTIRDSTGSDGSCTLAGIPAGFYTIEAFYTPQKGVNPKLYAARADNVSAGMTDSVVTVILELQPFE